MNKQIIKELPLFKILTERKLLVPETQQSPIVHFSLGNIHYIGDVPFKQTSYSFRANLKDEFAPREGQVDVFVHEDARVLDLIKGTSYEVKIDPFTHIVLQVIYKEKYLPTPKIGRTRYGFCSAGPHQEVRHSPATKYPEIRSVDFKGDKRIESEPIPAEELLPELPFAVKDGAIILNLENGVLRGNINVPREHMDQRSLWMDITDKLLMQRTYIEGVTAFNEVVKDLQLTEILGLDLTARHYKDI